MGYTIQDIAAALGAKAQGATDILIDGLAEPSEAEANELALASNASYVDALAQGKARAALLWDGADWRALGLEAAVLVARPRFAMSTLTRLYDELWRVAPPGVHETAFVAPTARVADASIGPYSVTGEGVDIAPGAVIGSHVTVGNGTRIGVNALIRDGVRISQGVRIGARFVGQPGVIIGGDGFSFTTAEPSAAETVRATLGEDAGTAQAWERIHSLGGVEIGDDVEIGSGSSVDRGTIRATRIGDGTKIDSLVQVGHNVQIGRHCLLCAQAGVAGSSTLGDHVILGGQTGVADNISLGDRVVTGGGTIVMSNVPSGRVMLGYPATQMRASLESYKALRRLPRDISQLKKAVSKLMGSD